MYSSRTRSRPAFRVERDWLGRRLDLRECHRDPTCRTHHDPLAPCTCHTLFIHWDWVVDWLLCSGLVAAVVMVVWTLVTIFSSGS
jgi:hypothetical protein